MIALLAASSLALLPIANDGAVAQAATYCEAIEKLNAEHARRPNGTEEELARRLPARAAKALEKLVAMEDARGVEGALVSAAEASLEIDRLEDFTLIKARLGGEGGQLGAALTRPRFQLRGIGVDEAYLEHFAEILEAVLEGFDETFGFREFSKVPGKKLRVRVHLEEKIERPPHFAPQFPYHSQIDFPIVDPKELQSPTRDGKFLFYGLCHELGHVIAMWGDRTNEEDRHVWAHYVGVVVCQQVAEEHKKARFMQGIRDVRWRSYDRFKKENEGVQPSTEAREGIAALLGALHEEVGPLAVGAAINHLDAKDRRLRINHVRYYTFRELEDGLLETVKTRKARRAVTALFRARHPAVR